MASNLSGNTKLYLASLATFRAVFPTVDVYPDWKNQDEAQAVVVATSETRPDPDALIKRAATLQTQHHFSYPLSELVAKRVPVRSNEDGDLLTDDFAPVNLYETTPAHAHKRE